MWQYGNVASDNNLDKLQSPKWFSVLFVVCLHKCHHQSPFHYTTAKSNKCPCNTSVRGNLFAVSLITKVAIAILDKIQPLSYMFALR